MLCCWTTGRRLFNKRPIWCEQYPNDSKSLRHLESDTKNIDSSWSSEPVNSTRLCRFGPVNLVIPDCAIGDSEHHHDQSNPLQRPMALNHERFNLALDVSKDPQVTAIRHRMRSMMQEFEVIWGIVSGSDMMSKEPPEFTALHTYSHMLYSADFEWRRHPSIALPAL